MFPRSTSNSSLDKEILFDKPDYSKEFLIQRNSRTLSLRRKTNILTIANFKKTESSREFTHKHSNGSIEISNSLQNQEEEIELNEFLETFNSGDETKIIQLSDMLIRISNSTNKDLKVYLHNIINSKEAGESFGMALSMAESEKLIHSLFKSLTLTFPLFSTEAKAEIISGSATIKASDSLADFCEQCNKNECTASSINLLIDVCQFIIVLSKSSTYARDSFFCYSINECLLNMLTSIVSSMKQNQEQISELQLGEQSNLIICALTDALRSIYVSKLYRVDNLSDQITDNIIEQMIKLISLLDGMCLHATKSIMACLISISSNYQTAVKYYFKNKLDLICISMLEEPELTETALNLLGNMCTAAEPSQLIHLVETEDDKQSLFQILVDLIPTEFAAFAFWIMSSLFDNLPNELMKFITTEFIQYVISVAESSNYKVRKESTFFLATVITKVPAVYIPQFAQSQELIDMLIDMLACDDKKVIILCFFAISFMIKRIQETKGTDEVVKVFCGTELTNQIEILKLEHEEIISDLLSYKDSTFDALINSDEFLSTDSA